MTNKPFSRSGDRGSMLLGIPPWGDGTARGGYGRRVFELCGYRCAYCGYEMAGPYEAWLSLSVDHVVPAHLVKAGWPKEWVLDLVNLVTCCRACYEFLNGYRVADLTPPATLDDFIAIRDRAFDEKIERAKARHAVEQNRYVEARQAGPTEVQEEIATAPQPEPADELEPLTAKAREFVRERDWEQFHKPKDLALSLMLEAAEVAELMQWKEGDELDQHLATNKERLGEELADVLWFVLLLAHYQGIALADAFERKLGKNAENYPVEKSRGRADKYNEPPDG